MTNINGRKCHRVYLERQEAADSLNHASTYPAAVLGVKSRSRGRVGREEKMSVQNQAQC